MRAWLMWLVLIGVLTTLASLKIGVRISFRNDLDIKLLVGKFCFSFADKEKKSTDATAKSKSGGGRTKRRVKPWLQAALDHWTEILELVARVLSAPTLDILRVNVSVGGKEPDQCALNYGRICALIGILLAPVENIFEIRRRSVNVQCAFDRTDIELDAEAAMTLRVYEIVALALSILKLGIGLYRQAKSNMKVV